MVGKHMKRYSISLVILGVCVCVCVCARAQLCLILYHPMDSIAYQTPLSREFFRQDYRSKLPFPTSGDLPNPGIEPVSLEPPALAGGFFATVSSGF